MYLITGCRLHGTPLFFIEDPRTNPRFPADLQVEQVTLYDPIDVNVWPDGRPAPDIALGVSLSDPTRYQFFTYTEELAPAGFRHVHSGGLVPFFDWADFLKEYRPEQIVRLPA